MENNMWRFPATYGGGVKGFDTGEVETFKTKTVAGLAREMIQNSIDAKDTAKEAPVKVSFKMVRVKRDEVPGVSEIRNQIEGCKRYYKTNPAITKTLQRIENKLNEEYCDCMIISDRNTTGVKGVLHGLYSAWQGLVKGIGVSVKDNGSLGSKGIGKTASFVCSDTNLVFYSTYNTDSEKGYEGVIHLCSGYLDEADEILSQGYGYYSYDEKNNAIEGDLPFDWAIKRGLDDFGTDIYIFDFKEPNNWENTIISNVLDSFLVAIYNEYLQIEISGKLIDRNSLVQYIYDEKVFSDVKTKKRVRAVYECLKQGENVKKIPLKIGDYEDIIDIYIRKYKGNDPEKGNATKSIIICRYPYMVIERRENISVIPVSVLVVLPKGDISNELRKAENPEHNKWNPKEIDDKDERVIVNDILNEFNQKLTRIVQEELSKSGIDSTDFGGAGEFLPEEDFGEQRQEKDDQEGTEEIESTPLKRNHVAKQTVSYEDGQATEIIQPDIGKLNDQEGDYNAPEGENKGKGNDGGPGDRASGSSQGETVIFKRIPGNVLPYRIVCVNRHTGTYMISVTPLLTADNVTVVLTALDDSSQNVPINIETASVNNTSLITNKNVIEGVSFKKNAHLMINIVIDKKEYISGKVSFYENRK